MTIRARCPHCGRTLEVERAGLYTCKQCKQVVRIEGKAYSLEMFVPFVSSGIMATEDSAGRSARCASKYLKMCSRFLAVTS